MKKFLSFLALNSIFVFLYSTTVFANSTWDESPVYDRVVSHIVTSLNNESYARLNPVYGEDANHWSYSIFYCAPNSLHAPPLFYEHPGYLIFLSHGYYDSDGYQIVINGYGYRDYADAVDYTLNHFRKLGLFNNLDYSYVLVNTCYPGYMNYESYLPRMNTNMVRIIKHYDITGHQYFIDDYGNLRLQLYKGHSLYTQGINTGTSLNLPKTVQHNGRTLIIE